MNMYLQLFGIAGIAFGAFIQFFTDDVRDFSIGTQIATLGTLIFAAGTIL